MAVDAIVAKGGRRVARDVMRCRAQAPVMGRLHRTTLTGDTACIRSVRRHLPIAACPVVLSPAGAGHRSVMETRKRALNCMSFSDLSRGRTTGR